MVTEFLDSGFHRSDEFLRNHQVNISHISMSYRISIGLFGKGSTNHLHRKEVVEALRKKEVEVDFIVRSDYFSLVEKLDGCRYTSVSFKSPGGFRSLILKLCVITRYLYPSRDSARIAYYRFLQDDLRNNRNRIIHKICQLLARYRWSVRLISGIECLMFQPDSVIGINPMSIDQLLLLGIGTVNSELEAGITLWARHHKIPVIHIVGNYDNLSSKGFRGISVDRLIVWGPNMRDDAIRLHGIPPDRITMIGSIRYNTNSNILVPNKNDYIKSLGLDPARKTILFAGFMLEYHYFEMLEIYEQLLNEGENVQLILRVYPNKHLMNSVYIKPLLDYSKQVPNVYVSLADPNYGSGDRNREVLQIEENELWNSLNCCDVVINLFSTISLEACIFDKPALNMWYFQPSSSAFARNPVYWDYSQFFHNRRIISYGAIKTARNREELISLIRDALTHPDALSVQRRRTVEDECGPLDGKACERLVDICVKEYKKKQYGQFDGNRET